MAKKETVLTYIFDNPNSPKETEQILKMLLLEKLLAQK